MNDPVPPCRVIVDTAPRKGVENMELDESLLERVTEDPSTSFVRIYRWSEPTVSIGYFQQLDGPIDPRIAHCPRVRRVTGGGAILHDQEVTYSCVLPATHPVRGTPTQLYELVHTAVIELLGTMEISSSMRQDSPEQKGSVRSPDNEPFLCFLRSDPRDVVLRGQKILGSAQRRRRGSILQHGSILMRASSLTPDVVGICDLADNFDEITFAARLPAIIGDAVAQKIRV